MAEVSFRGGSRIGWVNASYPFARLTCTRERLVLSSFGLHEFTSGQVVTLNLLLLGNFRDFPAGPPAPRPDFGPGMPAACILAFLLATGIKHAGRLRRLALARGHALGEVRGMLTLLQRVALPLGIGFGAAWLLGGP